MPTQKKKAEAFAALHQRPGCFVIPNPWDAGTAKMLTTRGFEALATTSAGLAFALGRIDGSGTVTRVETLENARQIVEATELPVAADLENCFADHHTKLPKRSPWLPVSASLAGRSRTRLATPRLRSTISTWPLLA